MKKYIIILFAFASIVYVLIPEKSQDVLGDNYFYLTPYEAIDVGFPEGAIIYKSPQKNLFRRIVIDSQVVAIDYNEDFIIAIQEKINDSNNKKLKNYYIINKKYDKVYGPFNKEEFKNKRIELNVSSNLTLNEEN